MRKENGGIIWLSGMMSKKPFNQGGLGIRSIVEMNVALQGKWLWRFLKEDVRMWRRIIKLKWGGLEEGGTYETTWFSPVEEDNDGMVLA